MTRTRRSTTITARDARHDAVKAQGRQAALDGKPNDIPMGNEGNLGQLMAAIPDRSSWLIGWRNGIHELEDLADSAVRVAAAADPVAVAALRYADVVHGSAILRHFDDKRAARAKAARAFIDALRTSGGRA